MPDLTQQFAGPAQFTDPTPNQDFNSALGLGANPNDDFATSFGKAFSAGMYRNSPEGKALMGEVAKQKLANQLAEQLYERKLQLENQYQPYDASHLTPWGAVVQTGKSGASQTINPMGGDQNDPSTPAGLAFQTWQNQQKAAGKKAEYESTDDFYTREKAKDEAQTRALTSRANYEDENAKTLPAYRKALEDARIAAANAKTNPPVKPPDAKQQAAATQAAIGEIYVGYNPKDQFGISPANKQFKRDMLADPAGTTQRINQKAEEILNRGRASGIAAPGSNMQDLLNLGNSPVFSPQQGMLDQ